MEKKKLQSVSIAALIVSILPLAALAPLLLHLSLSDGDRTTWAGANVVFVLLGLILSVWASPQGAVDSQSTKRRALYQPFGRCGALFALCGHGYILGVIHKRRKTI